MVAPQPAMTKVKAAAKIRVNFSSASLSCLLLISACFSSMLWAQPNQPSLSQSFASCALITSEYLTSLQLYQRGVSKDQALSELPNISRSAQTRTAYVYDLAMQQGLLNTYADINTNFARCSKQVYQRLGKPAPDNTDYGFYYCAGENKLRFEMILRSNNQAMSRERYLALTPDSHLDIALRYYQLIQHKGVLAAFDYTANNLKRCLSNF